MLCPYLMCFSILLAGATYLKHVNKVAVELKKIYNMHGTPDTPQNDRGTEFYGTVKQFSDNKKIMIAKSRAYHPKSQGKVERSHRTLRKKINYDLVKQGRKGVNWSKTCQNMQSV